MIGVTTMVLKFDCKLLTKLMHPGISKCLANLSITFITFKIIIKGYPLHFNLFACNVNKLKTKLYLKIRVLIY